jgi:hypothetical protein
LVLEAILVSVLGILLLVGFIVLRRWYRARYFHKRNQRTVALRSQWDDILSGKIAAENWRFNPLDCDIVESILLDSIEMSPADKLPAAAGLPSRQRVARYAHLRSPNIARIEAANRPAGFGANSRHGSDPCSGRGIGFAICAKLVSPRFVASAARPAWKPPSQFSTASSPVSSMRPNVL